MASPFDIKPPDPGQAAAMLQQQAQAQAARGASLGAPGQQAQQQAVDQLGQLAQGLGPSPAQLQLQQQAQANQQAAMAMASQGRGGNVAGNFNAALAANAGAQQATNAQAAIQRAQEQQAAIAGLGQMGGQMVGQELAFNQLGQQGQIAGGQQAIDWNLGDRAADLARDQFKFQKGNAIANTVIGGIGAVAGAAGMMSDERAKYGIQPTAQSASDAVGEVDPISYRYKPGLGPYGQQFGVSAQQLEGTSLGPQLVREGPDGFKRVDIGGMASASLAATAEQEQRLRRLEASLSAQGQAGGGGGMGLEAEAAAQRRADTVEAQRRMESARLAGEMQRGAQEASAFAGAPQMMRGGLGPERLSGAQTVDPFGDGMVARKAYSGTRGGQPVKVSRPVDDRLADNRRAPSMRVTPSSRSA